jgi:predicted short-subunit dehydrogenase-like oxidoreductase (DUF2520 family)
MKIFVFGQGKVGKALAVAWKKAGHTVTARAARKGWPARPIDVDAVLLAVRDGELGAICERAAAQKTLPKRAVVFHAAGSKSADALAALRPVVRGVAQFHPMISFASPQKPPSLTRGHVHVAGDPAAERVGRALARALGMTPRTFGTDFDPIGYHAAAGLAANGAAALAALAAEVLVKAGVPREVAPALLGPLLRSVGDNVEALGLPAALTGPVRRGDVAGVRRHDEMLTARCPEAQALYRAATAAQIPLAETLGDAPKPAFAELRKLVAEWSMEPVARRRT